MSMTEDLRVIDPWYLRGEIALSCNCEVFCPCVLSLGRHAPTEGYCQTWAGVRIDDGGLPPADRVFRRRLPAFGRVVAADDGCPLGDERRVADFADVQLAVGRGAPAGAALDVVVDHIH